MKIFIVEDDIWFSEILEYHLSLNPDFEVEKFPSGKDCLRNLYKKPEVVVLDYNLPDLSGEEILLEIKREYPSIFIVIVSGQEDVETAINLLKKGADDYIVKNEETKEHLWLSMNKIKAQVELRKEVETLQDQVKKKYDFSKIIKGNSKPMQTVFNLMQKASGSNITVSVTGETGTGKELVAQAIHFNSTRNKKPFVAVNVAAIPKELIESELFGHEKGAFTGADKKRIGKFEEADKGTIFLDEIGEMDLNMQTKLLRVLQEREVTRVGGNNATKIDIRVITATHKNLLEEIQEGRFREDLYYRLYGLPIELPPLRSRGNDILILAKFFADQFCNENRINKKTFSSDAQEKLLDYHYPGNVRELKAAIDLTVLMSDNDEIQKDEINFIRGSSISSFLKKEMTLKEYEYAIVSHFLEKYDRNVIKVAQKLDIGKSTIYRMLKATDT